jgi:hypothetical protein
MILDGLLVIQPEKKYILKKEHLCIIFQSDVVIDGNIHLELFRTLKHYKMDSEGLVENIFHQVVEEERKEEKEDRILAIDKLPTEIFDPIICSILDDEDIVLVRGAIDTDNDIDNK